MSVDRMCLIGEDIIHSKSPELYNNYFKIHNIDCNYFLMEIHSETELKHFLSNLDDIVAFNITMPYKKMIVKYLDTLDKISKNAGSVNLVIKRDGKLYGYNTDGVGFFNFLYDEHFDISGKDMLLIGYGGAGASIYEVAKERNVKSVKIITHEKAKAIDEKYIDNIGVFDLVVNASNVGFKDSEMMPIPEKLVNKLAKNNKNMYFVDIIYKNSETALLRKFREYGIKNAYNGEKMLEYQFLANINLIDKTYIKL